MGFIDSKIMRRYLRRESSPREDEEVLKWMMGNLKSKEADGDFEKLYDSLPVLDRPDRKSAVKRRILDYIHKNDKRKRLQKGFAISASIAALSAAASLLIGLIHFADKDEIKAPASWSEIVTAHGEKKSVTLPDGSVIWLHDNARVLYPSGFKGKTRQIFTSGEIFAEISKDKSRPFIVSADKINVVVTGTTFNFASSSTQKTARLTLIEGGVNINYLTKGGNKIIGVHPGEEVCIDLQTEQVTTSSCDIDNYVSWKDKRDIYFKNISLSEIAESLNREFGVRVVIEDASLSKNKYYASFINGESPLEILKILLSDSNAGIIQKDATIYIRK